MPHQQPARDPQDEKVSSAELGLPAAVRAAADGQLDGQTIVGWAEYDLDESNRYTQRFAVLTEARLVLLHGGRCTILAIAAIGETKIIEDLGLDRLVVYVQDKPAAEIRYTRRCRRDVTRLNRKLQRRLTPRDPSAEPLPEWLEVVERQAEAKERCPKCGQVIPAYAEGVCPQCLRKRGILWRLLDVAKPYRGMLHVALALTLMQAALSAVPPVLHKYLVDHVLTAKLPPLLGGSRIQNLLLWGAASLLIIAIMETVGLMRVRLLAIIGTSVARDLRHNVYAHMHELSLHYFGKRRTGSLITRVTNDTDRLWDFIVFGSVSLIRDFLVIIIIAVVMFVINWKLAAISLLPVPVLALALRQFNRRVRPIYRQVRDRLGDINANLHDNLSGICGCSTFSAACGRTGRG